MLMFSARPLFFSPSIFMYIPAIYLEIVAQDVRKNTLSSQAESRKSQMIAELLSEMSNTKLPNSVKSELIAQTLRMTAKQVTALEQRSTSELSVDETRDFCSKIRNLFTSKL